MFLTCPDCRVFQMNSFNCASDTSPPNCSWSLVIHTNNSYSVNQCKYMNSILRGILNTIQSLHTVTGSIAICIPEAKPRVPFHPPRMYKTQGPPSKPQRTTILLLHFVYIIYFLEPCCHLQTLFRRTMHTCSLLSGRQLNNHRVQHFQHVESVELDGRDKPLRNRWGEHKVYPLMFLSCSWTLSST